MYHDDLYLFLRFLFSKFSLFVCFLPQEIHSRKKIFILKMLGMVSLIPSFLRKRQRDCYELDDRILVEQEINLYEISLILATERRLLFVCSVFDSNDFTVSVVWKKGISIAFILWWDMSRISDFRILYVYSFIYLLEFMWVLLRLYLQKYKLYLRRNFSFSLTEKVKGQLLPQSNSKRPLTYPLNFRWKKKSAQSKPHSHITFI